MSKEFLTKEQAGIKVGSENDYGNDCNFMTKVELLQPYNHSDASKLTGYAPGDYPVDDDIVLKNIVPAGKHFSGTMIPNKWAYDTGYRYGYYSENGSYRITTNEIETITSLGCLMIEQRGNLTFWGPIFHGDTGTVPNVNRVALTFSFFNGHYMEGIVANPGTNWWAFMSFVNQDDWKQKIVDGMTANVGKTITWDMVFWYE